MRTLPARGHYWLAIGLALILGGAVGNAYDRFADGYVVDYLHFHWGEHYFPAFNVADIGITTGAIMLIIDAFLSSRRSRAPAP
jgi:signal peptidase II